MVTFSNEDQPEGKLASAAALLSAPIAYIKIISVKKLVLAFAAPGRRCHRHRWLLSSVRIPDPFWRCQPLAHPPQDTADEVMRSTEMRRFCECRRCRQPRVPVAPDARFMRQGEVVDSDQWRFLVVCVAVIVKGLLLVGSISPSSFSLHDPLQRFPVEKKINILFFSWINIIQKKQ